MLVESVKFRYQCFRDWSGLDKVCPINVIIGRNNSGKTRLIDFIAELVATSLSTKRWDLRCRATLDEASLRQRFQEGRSGGILHGDWWRNHGQHFVGQTVEWECSRVSQDVSSLEWSDAAKGLPRSTQSERVANERRSVVTAVCRVAKFVISEKRLCRMRAERDIIPEVPQTAVAVDEHGHGVTNLVRRYLLSAALRDARSLVKHDLLGALNQVFADDGQFDEIDVQEHEAAGGTNGPGKWEVVLVENQKGRVPLSESGSGLKTVLLVLLNMLVIPKMEKKSGNDYVFAFEELENNLHPALLRRLLRFIADYVENERCTVFLSTHSSVMLDVFGTSKDAQIIRVTHEKGVSRTDTVATHFDRQDVVTRLGAKPSDLLQANGVVWVEGPSDRVYLNRWIELASRGTLREGRDYQCAFYGGSLLKRAGFTAPDEGDDGVANLLRLNPNVVVVCDSDRKDGSDELKERVQRVQEEVAKVPSGFCWVASAREIENYLTAECLAGSGLRVSRSPRQFEPFFRRQAEPQAYVDEQVMGHVDKVELAEAVVGHMTEEAMNTRFDWQESMARVVEVIRQWNA